MYNKNSSEHVSVPVGRKQGTPVSSKHSVKPGETVAAIETMYHMPPGTLAKKNPHLIGRGNQVSPDMILNV